MRGRAGAGLRPFPISLRSFFLSRLSGALLLLSLALWNKILLLLPRHLSFTVTHMSPSSEVSFSRHLDFFFTKFLPGCWGMPTSCLHFPTSGACDLGEAWVAPTSSSSVAVASSGASPSNQGGSDTLYLEVASISPGWDSVPRLPAPFRYCHNPSCHARSPGQQSLKGTPASTSSSSLHLLKQLR